jgi:hypothetical protein
LDAFAPPTAAVPGISSAAPRMTITAGASTETRIRVALETVSCSVKGKEMSGSVREKGRWLGSSL